MVLSVVWDVYTKTTVGDNANRSPNGLVEVNSVNHFQKYLDISVCVCVYIFLPFIAHWF